MFSKRTFFVNKKLAIHKMLKTKQMINILGPIKHQIERLSELCSDELDSTKLDSLKLAVIKQLRLLAEKFENAYRKDADSYSDLKSKITNIIEEFCIINFEREIDNESNDSVDEISKLLLEKFEQSLVILEQLQVTPIVQNITDCYDYVTEMGKSKEIEDIRNVVELGDSIIDILKSIQLYRKSIVSEFLKNQLSLYGSQLCISCILLVEVIKRQHQLGSTIYLCKKYACDRLCSCLEALKTVLNSSNSTLQEESSSKENNFVYRVDLVLDIITDMNHKDQKEQIEDCKDLWFGIEDIFTHAMSIAQVCQPYNFEAISGSCQTIMSNFENLKMQLEADPPDQAMNLLYMNALSDSIYRLERKINISILILVMEIFSNPFHTLKKLIKICSISLKERSKVDLNSLIEAFDQTSDKCIQIGKFAISCCKNENRVNKIRSCLASFESLEMELIPAIAALYLHPDDKEMRECVKFLTNQWQTEMDKFHGTIDLIIDPSAYCQVVLDDLIEKVGKMSDQLNNLEDITQAQVQDVVCKASTLCTQINATVDDIGQENVDKQSKILIREFKAAIYEVDAASKKFLTTKAIASEQLRIINRCQILVKIIQRLQTVLSNIVNNSLFENISIHKKSIDASIDVLKPKNTSKNNLLTDNFTSLLSNISDVPVDLKTPAYIKTPYSVKSFKPQLSIKPPGTLSRKEPNTSVLIPYIQKGKILRQEFSIMYKTPKKPDVQMNLPSRNLSNVRQHLFSRNSLLEDSNLQAESIDLTNILEKLTRLTNTTSSGEFRIPSAKKNIFPESVVKKFAAEKVSSKCLSNVTGRLADCSLKVPEVKAKIDIITRL